MATTERNQREATGADLAQPMEYVYDDGGRAAAGFKGETSDCGPRAVAIATGLPYADVYEALRERQESVGYKASPRNGTQTVVLRDFLADLGWTWHPTMSIGSGTTVHMRADELPPGRLIVRVSKHFAAVVDGVLHDNHDCTREGTRAVYGYWTPPSTVAESVHSSPLRVDS